jgi:predicted dehydrogenase
VKFKAATIGCGRMGAFGSVTATEWTPDFWQPISHLPAIQGCTNTLVVGAADISAQIRARVTATFDIPCYASADELFADHAIDILTLATRTPEKPKLIRQALAAGVRGFHIEKPLCNTLMELTDLKTLLHDIPVTYGCLRRYLSPYRNLANIAQNHRLGELTAMQVHSGRGMLYWTHPHSIDMMLMQTEQTPIAVQANFSPTQNITEAPRISLQEDPFVLGATVFFNGGVTGHITPLAGDDFWTVHEKGALGVMNDGRALLVRQSRDGDPYPNDKPVSYEVTNSGGTGAAIDLLSRAMSQDPAAKLEVSRIKNDMFLGQHCLFAMAQSHLQGGSRVNLEDVTGIITLAGLYNGVPS